MVNKLRMENDFIEIKPGSQVNVFTGLPQIGRPAKEYKIVLTPGDFITISVLEDETIRV